MIQERRNSSMRQMQQCDEWSPDTARDRQGTGHTACVFAFHFPFDEDDIGAAGTVSLCVCSGRRLSLKERQRRTVPFPLIFPTPLLLLLHNRTQVGECTNTDFAY